MRDDFLRRVAHNCLRLAIEGMRSILAAVCVLLLFVAITLNAQTPQTITIDANASGTPFPHFWEQMFGSGRAVLALRAAFQSDMREVKQITDFRYVRGHAILHDEVGVYS